MAATSSTMLDLGTPAPPFSLPDVVSKRTVSLDSFASRKALLVKERAMTHELDALRAERQVRLTKLGASLDSHADQSAAFPALAASPARTAESSSLNVSDR